MLYTLAMSSFSMTMRCPTDVVSMLATDLHVCMSKCVQAQQHDYGRATVHAHRLSSPDGTSNTTGKADRASGANFCLARRWARPRAQSPSRPTLSSSSGAISASPEIGLGYLLAANPASDHFANCGISQGKLDRRLEKTFDSPEQGSRGEAILTLGSADAPPKKYRTSYNDQIFTLYAYCSIPLRGPPATCCLRSFWWNPLVSNSLATLAVPLPTSPVRPPCPAKPSATLC
jgi:hypothetical protein